MSDMAYIDELTLPKLRIAQEIDKELETSLMNAAIVEWEPVYINGKNVIDGMQRVLIARKHGIKEIPCRRVK